MNETNILQYLIFFKNIKKTFLNNPKNNIKVEKLYFEIIAKQIMTNILVKQNEIKPYLNNTFHIRVQTLSTRKVCWTLEI